MAAAIFNRRISPAFDGGLPPCRQLLGQKSRPPISQLIPESLLRRKHVAVRACRGAMDL
jgi:hypothetical protein